MLPTETDSFDIVQQDTWIPRHCQSPNCMSSCMLYDYAERAGLRRDSV